MLDISASAVPDLEEWLKERAMITSLLRQHLLRVQQRMKFQVDKKRSERVFAVGDWVFLKAQPYAQHCLTGYTNHKLAFRYFGPFQVLEQVGKVAYRLQLPASCSIHPVVHVSQLRHASSPSSSDEIQVPVTLPADEEAVPVQVLSRRVYRKGARAVEQVKVRWQGQTSAKATWEDAAALRLRYPAAPAWGQAVSEGGGDVTDTVPGPATEGNPVKSSKRAVRVRRPNVRLSRPEWD